MNSLDFLAASSSVSFASRLDKATLSDILRTGRFEAEWTGHVAAIVDEAPIAMLARAVETFPPEERGTVLANLRALGGKFGARNRIERWLTG